MTHIHAVAGDDPDLLSLTGAAARCGMSECTFRRRVHANRGGAPKSVKVGRSVVFKRSDIDAWVRFQALG